MSDGGMRSSPPDICPICEQSLWGTHVIFDSESSEGYHFLCWQQMDDECHEPGQSGTQGEATK